jgi:hypothetical protein
MGDSDDAAVIADDRVDAHPPLDELQAAIAA